jgi:anti-sigma B factor antagonist
MSRPFELRSTDEVITVLGELDIGTAPHFRRAVGGLLVGEAPHLVIDLSEADFVDSSGIAAIVWALFRARAAGGDIVVVDAHDTVGPAIALAGLDNLIPLRRELPTADYFMR